MAKRGHPRKGEEKGRTIGAMSAANSRDSEIIGETGDNMRTGEAGDAEKQAEKQVLAAPLAKLVTISEPKESIRTFGNANSPGIVTIHADSGKSASDRPILRPEVADPEDYGRSGRVLEQSNEHLRNRRNQAEETCPASSEQKPNSPYITGTPNQIRATAIGSVEIGRIPAEITVNHSSTVETERETPARIKNRNCAQVAAGNRQIENGWTLNYTPIQNNTNMVKITPEESAEACENWKNSILGFVVGGKPRFREMENYARLRWGGDGGPKVHMLKERVFLFAFEDEDKKNKVMEQN